MATIENQEIGKQNGIGIKKPNKKSTTIDMTPMVDLGFLLITFFIFTTSLSLPKAMDMIVPKDDGPNNPIDQRGVLNIILSDKKAFVYEGKNLASIQEINFNEMRKNIIKKKLQCERNGIQEKFMVLIKPDKKANYKHLVDALDEMAINEVERYALVEIDKQENNFINNKNL